MIAAPDLAAVKDALGVTNDDDNARIERNIRAATELANRQAPDAPADVGHEAIIRCAAYLFEYPSIEASDAGLWRKCGSQGLLAPWTVRRAGAI